MSHKAFYRSIELRLNHIRSVRETKPQCFLCSPHTSQLPSPGTRPLHYPEEASEHLSSSLRALPRGQGHHLQKSLLSVSLTITRGCTAQRRGRFLRGDRAFLACWSRTGGTRESSSITAATRFALCTHRRLDNGCGSAPSSCSSCHAWEQVWPEKVYGSPGTRNMSSSIASRVLDGRWLAEICVYLGSSTQSSYSSSRVLDHGCLAMVCICLSSVSQSSYCSSHVLEHRWMDEVCI